MLNQISHFLNQDTSCSGVSSQPIQREGKAQGKHTTRQRTCCFTGHRSISESGYERISYRLEMELRKLIENGVTFYGAGGALGFDTIAAETVIRLREEFPHIKLILVLPCETQAFCWRQEDKDRYERIKGQADKTVLISREYTKDCMFRRNRHLVDGSSICLCYLTKGTGGTAYTVKYAREQGLEVINLACE